MDKIGILKKLDKLGRLVIPKEMRDRYQISEEVEIIATTEGILLRNSEYHLAKRETESKVAKE